MTFSAKPDQEVLPSRFLCPNVIKNLLINYVRDIFSQFDLNREISENKPH